jgi:hypothetical protein
MKGKQYKRAVSILFAVGVSAMQACRPQPGDDDYARWVQDYENGMHVKYSQNELAFDLQFQPSEYVWVQQNGRFNKTAFEEQRVDFNRMQYFKLSIYSKDGTTDVVKHLAMGDVQRNGELLYYFSYRFQNDMYIEEGSRRWPCVLFHYEQHGTRSFVLGFQKDDEPITDAVFTIDSPVLDTVPVRIKVFTPKAL